MSNSNKLTDLKTVRNLVGFSAGDTAAVGRTVDGGEDEDHGGAAKVTVSGL